MACSRDTGGRYESWSHWSDDWYSRAVRDFLALVRCRTNPEGITDCARSGWARITTRQEDRPLTCDSRWHRLQSSCVLRYRREVHVRVTALYQEDWMVTVCEREDPWRNPRLVRDTSAPDYGRLIVTQMITSDTSGGCILTTSQGSTSTTTIDGSMCGGRVVNVSLLVQQWHAYKGAFVMMWWCISLTCKLPVVEIHGNMNAMFSTLSLCHTSTTTRCSTSPSSCAIGSRRTLRISQRTCFTEKPWMFWIGQAKVLI